MAFTRSWEDRGDRDLFVTLGHLLEDGLNSVLGRPSGADKQRAMIFMAFTRSC